MYLKKMEVLQKGLQSGMLSGREPLKTGKDLIFKLFFNRWPSKS